jgi:hypothetical protein
MIANESLKITGDVEIDLKDEHGNTKLHWKGPNTTTSTGKALLANRLIGNVTGANVSMSHMAVGTSTSAATTALAAEISGGRAVFSVAASAANNVITYTTQFSAGVGTGAIVEAGIFNAASAGVMLCRTTFPVVNKESSDVLTIIWTVTVN